MLNLFIAICLETLSYLACVDASVEPRTDHISGDMVAVDFRLPTRVVRNQSHSTLLQSGVAVCLCQIKTK